MNVIDQARDALKEHQPVEIEPSDTICSACSHQLPNGRFMGRVVDFPCDAHEYAAEVVRLHEQLGKLADAMTREGDAATAFYELHDERVAGKYDAASRIRDALNGGE